MIALIIILVILLLFHILYFILLPFVHGGEKSLRQIWVWWEDGSEGAWTENQQILVRDLLFRDINTSRTLCVTDDARDEALALAENYFEFERFVTILHYRANQLPLVDMTDEEVEQFKEVLNACYDPPANDTGFEVLPGDDDIIPGL